MSRTASESAGPALRMILPMTSLLRTMAFAPATDRCGDLPQERDDPVAVGRRAVLDQRDQVAEERVVGSLVEPPPLGGEPDLEAPAVPGMVDPLHVPLPL